MGPKASPSTYMLSPSNATLGDTPMSFAKSLATGLNPLAPQETLRSMGIIAATMNHFRAVGQLRGSSGSLGSNVITLDGALGSNGSRSVCEELMSAGIRRGDCLLRRLAVDALGVCYCMTDAWDMEWSSAAWAMTQA